MDPEENPHECEVCGGKKPSIIHTVHKTFVLRRLCTDCLLKEQRQLFCPVCFTVFRDVSPPSQDRIICLKCPSMAHVSCTTQVPSSSSTSPPVDSNFTCPPCSDPNFTFFPKSPHKPDTPISIDSAKALVAAAEISVDIMKHAVAQLQDEALKKNVASATAKMKAKEAMENLQIVLSKKGSQNFTVENLYELILSDKDSPNVIRENLKELVRSKKVSPNVIKENLQELVRRNKDSPYRTMKFLQGIFGTKKDSPNVTPTKRKNDDR